MVWLVRYSNKWVICGRHNVDLTIQGGINEQAANVQGGDANEQGGVNEQNDEQEGAANEQGGANEQNDEQEGDANEQGGENEQNHEQEGDANEDVDLLAEGMANVWSKSKHMN